MLLFELLSGAKPFDAPTLPELYSAILKDRPKAWPTSAPHAIRLIVERCLDKDPAQRYQSARELQRGLEAVESGSTPIWTTWHYRLRQPRWMLCVAAVLVLTALAWAFDVASVRDRFTAASVSASPIRLAVLPFRNLTGDSAQEFFSDGLTDETISQLGRLHPARLSVIARTSTMPYKTQTASIGEIGRKLGVAFVLEGSARREGNRVRVGISLIRVSDETQLWTNSYERELTSILTLQNDLARGVAAAMALQLLPADSTRVMRARPIDPAAYEAYLLGMSHVDRLTPANLDLALRYFEQAIATDPSYALAHVGVYRVWASRQQLIPAFRRSADQPRRAALAKAVDLDDGAPEVQAALAGQAVTDWDWVAADRSFRQAIELNPSFAEARASYSQYLNQMKRPDEAMVQIQRAIELDPLNPSVQTLYGLALNDAGQPEAAIEQFQNVLSATPDSVVALTGLQGALTRLGRKDEALGIQRKRAAARSDNQLEEALGRGGVSEGAAGIRQAVETLEARTRDGEDVNEVQLALMHLQLKELDRALDWLERAFASHNPNLPGINNRRPFDALRGHPRFEALLQRMNLPK